MVSTLWNVFETGKKASVEYYRRWKLINPGNIIIGKRGEKSLGAYSRFSPGGKVGGI